MVHNRKNRFFNLYDDFSDLCIKSKKWEKWLVKESTVSELEKVIMPPVNAGLDYLHSSMRRFWESEFPDSKENLAYWTKKISDITTIGVGSVGLDSDFIEELQLVKSIETTKTDIAKIFFLGVFFIFLK